MTPHPLHPTLLAGRFAVIAVIAVLAHGAASAQALSAPADRISDTAIQADHQAYEATQARLKALNDGGRLVRDYHLSKAQCWLDVSFHEYTRNDRGSFPQDALAQAQGLAQAMATGQPPLTWDTPLISGAQRLRPDLWDQAAALKGQPGWRCAAQKTACAEVELVHAGHEQAQLGWRHAKPYVQIAEDLIGEARLLAERCDPPAPAPTVAVAVAPTPPLPKAEPASPPPKPAAPPLARRVEFSAVVVFEFDRSDEAGLRPESRHELQALVERVRAAGLVPRHLQLVGHADRLNGTGNAAYNQRLSERRAATVQAVLARLGLPATGVGLEALGNDQQVLACSGRFATPALQQACLLPNRRVELRLIAEDSPGR